MNRVKYYMLKAEGKVTMLLYRITLRMACWFTLRYCETEWEFLGEIASGLHLDCVRYLEHAMYLLERMDDIILMELVGYYQPLKKE